MAKKDSRYYLKAAEDSGKVRVVNGRGDHHKLYATVPIPPDMRNPMICPQNLKGDGTECAIRKWLLRLGVLLPILLAAIFLWNFL